MKICYEPKIGLSGVIGGGAGIRIVGVRIRARPTLVVVPVIRESTKRLCGRISQSDLQQTVRVH